MDVGTATVVASVVAAVGGVIVALVARESSRKKDVEIADVAKKIVSGIDTSRYQYEVSLVRNSARIKNMDGDALIERQMIGIRLKPGAQVLAAIHGATLTSGVFTKLPELTHRSQFDKAVSLTTIDVASNSCGWEIDIVGGLASDDPPLDLTIASEMSKSFVMSREAVRERYRQDEFKHEYLALTVDVPVSRAEIEVTFPDGFVADTYAVVFYPKSEKMDVEETNRIKSMIVRTPLSARLTVEQPKIPFRYAVYWTPK